MSRRQDISFAVVLKDKTHTIRIKHRGKWANLGVAPTTVVLAKLAGPDSSYHTPTVTLPTQTDDDMGTLRVVYDPLIFTAARIGWWNLDIYIGASGDEEPIERRYQFELQAKETEA